MHLSEIKAIFYENLCISIYDRSISLFYNIYELYRKNARKTEKQCNR